MDLSKLIHGSLYVFIWFFFILDTWISLSCSMDLLKLIYIDFQTLLHEFVQVVRRIFQSCSIDLSPFANKTKMKFEQDFKTC